MMFVSFCENVNHTVQAEFTNSNAARSQSIPGDCNSSAHLSTENTLRLPHLLQLGLTK